MKKYRNIMAIVLAGTMVLSLAACGSKDNVSATTTAAAETTAAPAQTKETGTAEADTKAPSGEKINITFWHAMGGSSNGPAMEKIIENFNASQDEVVVTGEYQGSYDDLITKLKATMQSGGLPDACQMYDVGTKFMIDSGFAVPVEDMFATTGYDKSAIMDVVAGYYSYGGKQYSMPFNVSSCMLLYNKDAFKAAGLDPDTPPATYEEVKEFAKKIVDSKAAEYGYTHPIYGWDFEQWLAGMGAYYGNNENGRAESLTAVDFDQNGAGLKIFQLCKELYDSDYFIDYGTTVANAETGFFSGQVAMAVLSSATLRKAVDAAAFEVGTGFLPKVEESEEGGAIIGGGSVWLLNTEDQARIEAAWKFLEYLSTPEAQATLASNTGYFAANPAAYELPELKAIVEENPNFLTAMNQVKSAPLNNYTAGVLSPVQTESRLLYNDVLTEVYSGSKTPEEAVAELAEKVNKAIENYNLSIQK